MWPSAGLTRLELGEPVGPGGLLATAWGGRILVEESKAERVLRTQFKPPIQLRVEPLDFLVR